MSTACKVTLQALEYVVKILPVGTNLALLYLLWALMSGAFLGSRGAIFPALLALGLTAQQVRRCSQAVRTGSWSIDALVSRWRLWATTQTQWQPYSYEGYRLLAVDVTAFWRSRLRSWAGKFFYRLADRAVKGIGFALVVQVGQNRGQRLPLLQRIVRAESASLTGSQFKAQVLKLIGQELAPHDVLVPDAGATVADGQTAGVARWVVRLDRNCTARRNTLPPRTSKKGRPAEYGVRVRPLPRRYKEPIRKLVELE